MPVQTANEAVELSRLSPLDKALASISRVARERFQRDWSTQCVSYREAELLADQLNLRGFMCAIKPHHIPGGEDGYNCILEVSW